VIRIAAVGDVHFGADSAGTLRPYLDTLQECADVLLLAGDLTQRGGPEEIRVLTDELADVTVPIVAVLGNHDLHSDCGAQIAEHCRDAGITVLEGESTVLQCNGHTLGIAGTIGFGGGFAGASASDFGEPEMKAFVRHTKDLASKLGEALQGLDTTARVALLHYSPVKDTLAGERMEIYPFLGSYLLAEAVDAAGADLVVHGHAHHGAEKGVTPGGVRVRNAAQPAIHRAYALYELGCG
jgi:Icc-related predicted phosphoesterase